MATVSQHQQASFASPIRGGSLDANVVRENDNTVANTYNAHDADATIHVQSDTGLPAAGTTGRLFFTTADRRLSYDNGSAWQTLTVDGASVTSGTLPSARLTGSYTGITGLGTVSVGEWDATPIGIAKGGTGNTATPTNGQLLIGTTAGAGFSLATLTAGANVTITNGAGAITIAAAGGTITGTLGATDDALVRANGTGGSVVQGSTATLSDAGVLAIPSLLNLSAAGAGQIQFPATQNASGDVNTLDDYEEGAWTPTANGVSFGGTNCRYTKIGRLVSVHGTVTWPVNANASAAQIIGLPFTVGSASSAVTLFLQGTAVQGLAQAGATLISIYDSAGSIADNASLSSLSVTFSMTYSV